MMSLGRHTYVCLASFPGPKRRRRKDLVSAICVLNCGGIPLPLHTIDILPYARDANIDTKCYTVHRFMAAYSMQETHSALHIQQLI